MDSDDDEQFLQDLLGKQKLKEGAKVAGESSKNLGKKDKEKVTGGGSFQSMGLPPTLLKSLLQRGFTTPTPIQRLALPAALATPARDIVGMARTGSGKTLAYMVPMIAKLGGQHSPRYGARALVLVPTRELALQVLKVGKDLARGYNRGKDGDAGEPLRWGMIVGGDSLEEQYAMMAGNPDVIIATPGRLLHLLVEMNADLRSVQYVVFDEADRLFELGFDTSLTEILSKLSPSRQTLLFSATLPKSLVEFAKAGLQNPKLVRLDAESKISTDLQMAFVSIKPKEKEAGLLLLLRDVIGVPQQTEEEKARNDWLDNDDDDDDHRRNKKRNFSDRKGKKPEKPDTNRELAAHQTIVFAATKHHVEYLSLLLTSAGYGVSAIYGSLDQAARRNQLSAFRAGRTSILVVTDLAARGIDIPILSNVVNYDFPVGSRTFVHRVGRTARAGRTGWAYSFITNAELAHLYDLQLFLGRPLLVAPLTGSAAASPDYSNSLVLGTIPRERLDLESDHFRTVLLEPNSTLVALLGVAEKGQKMYERSQAKASQESYRRAKELTSSGGSGLAGSEREEEGVHPIFADVVGTPAHMATSSEGKSRADLLAQVMAFRPSETIFELGKKGLKTAESQVMQKRRMTLGKAKARAEAVATLDGKGEGEEEESALAVAADEDEPEVSIMSMPGGDQADESDLEAVFDMPKSKKASKGDYRDPNVYMGYVQAGAEAERGYSLNEGASNFASQAASAAYDLTATDENSAHSATQKASMLRWDRKHKKFVKGDGTGSDNKKIIRTESGGKLPASFKSGSFDDWKKKQKVYMPKVGEAELRDRQLPNAGPGNKRYRHTAMSSGPQVNAKPKRDGKGGKFKDDSAAKKRKTKAGDGKDDDGKKRSSTSKGLMGGKRAGSQLKSVDQIRKERAQKAKRTARSTQPGKRKKK